MTLTVIKLGGSLMQSRELPDWLEQISILAQQSNVIIVPGGGIFADEVRTLQSQKNFDDEVAHRMALLAMAQFGYYLSNINTDIQIVDTFELINKFSGCKRPLIWLPLCLMDDDSEIPASWDYTSDSIALWLAIKIDAPKLLLIKSINKEEATDDFIDKGFDTLIGNYYGEIIFLNKTQHAELAQHVS